ncbi:hypothetical protein [Amylibacter sp. IMCC11727]|uniref:hypothetical protein n=1 Tax=Amylibacter sp. IMCC11727 TaxID=3039851 RepID=UPI00244DF94F|nr:hypothetical protein [Amylibacter sp. IMCC11727]WGI21201.1 hypothetical protein QBD29_13930 [Amylibacter sp. IMCC11727]
MNLTKCTSVGIITALFLNSYAEACSKPKEQARDTVEISGALEDQFNNFEPEGKARISIWPACPENCHFGFDHPSQNFDIKLVREGTTWRLLFDDGDTGKGTISFQLPNEARRYRLFYPSGQPSPPEPGYTALHMFPIATGTGIFAYSIGDSTQIKISMSSASGCIAPPSFKIWQVQVDNAKAFYTFRGRVKPR